MRGKLVEEDFENSLVPTKIPMVKIERHEIKTKNFVVAVIMMVGDDALWRLMLAMMTMASLRIPHMPPPRQAQKQQSFTRQAKRGFARGLRES
jgi:hypothetical protein